MALDKNTVIRGTDGRVYFDGELMVNAKSFEAKVTINKSEEYFNGDYTAKHIYMGNSIAGTFVGYKYDSYVLSKYADALATGIIPSLEITGTVENKGTGAKQSVSIRGVVPDEIMLVQFENNTISEEEIPFTADSYKVIRSL